MRESAPAWVRLASVRPARSLARSGSLSAALALALALSLGLTACRADADRPADATPVAEAPAAAPAAPPGAAPASEAAPPAPPSTASPAPAANASTSAPGSVAPASAPSASPSAAGDPAVPLPEVAAPFPAGLSGQLVFFSDRGGRTKIYTLDLASGQIRALTGDMRYRDENPRWSPDGTRIAFKSNRAHYEGAKPEQGDADYDIYTMAADGSDVRRVTTDPANEHDPVWMPDGQSLIFSSEKDSRGDLYRVRLADGHAERLTHHYVGRAIMPNVSPDGHKVAFGAQTMRMGQFWVYQVHVFDLETKTTTPLEGSGAACWPNWRPDSQGLAYVHLDKEPSAIQTLDLKTGARQYAVQDPKMWSYYPDWSPDGRLLALSVSPRHHDGEDWDLAIVDMSQPGKFTKLTTGPGNDRLPDWKPR